MTITLVPLTARKMSDLTGFVKDSRYFRIGDPVKLTAPNGDVATGTLGDFYGVGRIAGMKVHTAHFGTLSYRFIGDPVYTISKEN